MSQPVPSITLNDGRHIPQLGFGVWRIDDRGAEPAVAEALASGYRSVDTASLYGNESGVGRALAASGLDPADVYVTTKVWNDDQGYDATMRAFDTSLGRLGIDALDLYLIHWPCAADDRFVETFRALVELRDQGRLRSVGVSNFQPEHIDRLIDETAIVPAVNQIELHPYLQQSELRAYHRSRGIVTEAWAPLGAGKGLLDDETLIEVARRRSVTPAQVVLRWHLDQGTVVIPKSATPSRIRENFDVFEFSLTEADTAAVDGLDRGHRFGMHPDQVAAG
jgi:diketogulonate reductase-like aldo/keto reductase